MCGCVHVCLSRISYPGQGNTHTADLLAVVVHTCVFENVTCAQLQTIVQIVGPSAKGDPKGARLPATQNFQFQSVWQLGYASYLAAVTSEGAPKDASAAEGARDVHS